MANLKKINKIVPIVTAAVIMLSTLSVVLPISNLVSSAEGQNSSEITDEFDKLDKSWSFGSGISNKEIVADGFENNSALRISGKAGNSVKDFMSNVILNSSYNKDEKNVSQTVEFRRNDTSITRWGIGLIAASTESDPTKLETTGSAYGAIVCLADSDNDANHYKSWLTIFKVVDGKVEFLARTKTNQEWTKPEWKQRLKFDIKDEGGVIQLDASLYLYQETQGKWLPATHNVSVVDYDNPLVNAGYQGIVYSRCPNGTAKGTGKVDIFKYNKVSSVPADSDGTFAVTGKPSRLLFQRPATSESIQEQSSMTMQFDSNLVGKDLALSFMIRDVTQEGRVPGKAQPGWSDQCGGYQDFYFTNYNTSEGQIVDPDIKDCDKYTFYIKGTEDLKFKIGMFGYTRKIYITDIKLVETDSNHKPVNDVNLADEYGDLSNWSFFKYKAGQPGYIKFVNTTALSGKLYDIPENYFATYPEPLEKEQMIYHTGNSGAQPHLIQYVRVPFEPGKVYEYTGKVKAWNTGKPAVRIDIQWRSGGINASQIEGATTIEINEVTGDFKYTFTMPEKFVINKGTAQEEVKNTPRLDDGRVLLSIVYQAGTAISTYARPSFKAQGSDVELLRNTDFRLGFNDWHFLPGTLGGVYRNGEILYESPDTYYSGPGTGGEAKLMDFDVNMFWADRNEDYLPDEGKWWTNDMIKDEESFEEKVKASTVEGTVLDANGKPMSGATVLLYSDDQLTTKSDANGYFKFENIIPGTYELSLLIDDGTVVPLEDYIFVQENRVYSVNLVFARGSNVNEVSIRDSENKSSDWREPSKEEVDTPEIDTPSVVDKNDGKIAIDNKPGNKIDDNKKATESSDLNIVPILIVGGTVILVAGVITVVLIIHRKKKRLIV